ncbi:Fic family protein [Candidatus Gracilibacteria bacterium]|nr:Fic family protein [Candidatus Gracilibacteria bacterium]
MHIGKEAIKSSKIEGTKTEFDDLFIEDFEKTIEEKNDTIEVQNYIKSLNFGIKELKNTPLSFRLFSQIHKILLDGARGKNKNPGDIRRSQNWIGGTSLKNAFFIPPHKDDLSDLISDFENFLHNDYLEIPELIKIAIAHYQFETIHPYLDGNGRIGRLMIILYLIEKRIISKPVLYISDFFERNRGAYYDALTVARDSNDINHFIKFFLTGIIETCKSSLNTFSEIIRLKKDIDEKILGFGSKSENINKIMKYLYSKPIVSSKELVLVLGAAPAIVNSLIKLLIENGVLNEVTGFKRHKIFVFENYVKLFR